MRKKRDVLLSLMLILCAVLALVFIFKDSLIIAGLQCLIKRSLNEELSYEEKIWRDGSLSLKNVKMGPLLSAHQLTIDFSWKKPFSLQTHVHVSHPTLTISSDQENIAPVFAIPSYFFDIHWRVDQGTLQVLYQNEMRSFNFDFLSGDQKEEIGIATFYDEERELLVSFDLTHVDHQVQVVIEMPSVLLEKLPILNSSYLVKASGLITLQGVILLSEKNEINSLSTSCHIESLTLKNLTDNFSLEAKSCQALFTYSSQEGQSFWKALQTDIMLENASLSLGQAASLDLFRCDQISGQFGGIFANNHLKQLRCHNTQILNGYIQLIDEHLQGFVEKTHFSGIFDHEKSWQITSLECDLNQGMISSPNWVATCNGKVAICDDAFQTTLLKADFKGIPVDICLEGPFETFEMTTEFVADSKSFLEFIMNKKLESAFSYPMTFKGVTKKHTQGYSFSGCVSAFEEEIKLGVELGSSGDIKEGWLSSQKCTEKILQPFNFIPFSAEMSFCATFDTKAIDCFIQASHLHFKTESLEINLPHLGLKDSQFLNKDNWAHLTYTFSEGQPKITFPFKEATIKGESFELSNLKGEAEFKDESLFLTCEQAKVPLNTQCQLNNVRFDGVFDFQKKKSDISHLKADFIFDHKKNYQVTAESIIYLMQEDPCYTFDMKVAEKDGSLPILDLHGQAVQKESLQTSFSLHGNFYELELEIKGKKIADQWILEKMRLEDFNLQGSFLKTQEKWFCPYWEFKWKDVAAKGDAFYDVDHLSLKISKLEGLLSSSYNVRSDSYSHLFFSPDFALKDLSLTAYKDGKKEGALLVDCITYNQGLRIGKVNLAVEGFNIPHPLSMSWQDHVMTLTHQDSTLTAFFSQKGDCEEIRGNFLGLRVNLHQEKKPAFFTGSINIDDGSQLASFCPKHLFFLQDVYKLELKGLWQKNEEGFAFSGEIFGKDFSVKGYQLETFHAKLDFKPSSILMKEIDVSDKSGSFFIRQLSCMYNQKTLKWQVAAPLMRAKDIKPVKLCTKKSPISQDKPFCIRSLVFENLEGDLGDVSSFTADGSFNFTNAYKKEFSIFDAPLEVVKNFGFDPALFTPISGEVFCYLKNGALHFSDLKNTYSEGHRSQFYLASDPSYIDLKGEVNIYLRLKQDVVLKLGEPFSLNIYGSIDDLKYKLR